MGATSPALLAGLIITCVLIIAAFQAWESH
jgi:hypothetical protein